jgi:hypothetical protein
MANRILTDTPSIQWDFSVPNQAKANAVSGGGYGAGPFGTVGWDTTVVTSAAYTVLGQGVIIPNYATVGWGKEMNDTFFTPLNTMLSRLTALGV